MKNWHYVTTSNVVTLFTYAEFDLA